MPDKSHATIHITPGSPITVWCGHCLLPSAVAVPLYTIGSSGVSDVGTYRQCQDCEEDQ